MFFKRLGKRINRKIIKPTAKETKKAFKEVEKESLKLVKEIEKGGKVAVKELKPLAKEVVKELEDIGKEIQKLERKHRLIKYGGDVVSMGLKIAGTVTAQPELVAVGIAVDVGTEIASDQIVKDRKKHKNKDKKIVNDN